MSIKHSVDALKFWLRESDSGMEVNLQDFSEELRSVLYWAEEQLKESEDTETLDFKSHLSVGDTVQTLVGTAFAMQGSRGTIIEKRDDSYPYMVKFNADKAAVGYERGELAKVIG